MRFGEITVDAIALLNLAQQITGVGLILRARLFEPVSRRNRIALGILAHEQIAAQIGLRMGVSCSGSLPAQRQSALDVRRAPSPLISMFPSAHCDCVKPAAIARA